MRVDKWLYQARFFKSRAKASEVVSAGHLRINGVKVSKPASAVAVGDTLTFAQVRQIRVVEIAALGHRRGPAAEAQGLYVDHSPPVEKPPPRVGPRPRKKERRDAEFLKDRPLE
ncbi:MAG: RNA-binding S4 domain-containing protein [Pseudomonadota bacterium]